MFKSNITLLAGVITSSSALPLTSDSPTDLITYLSALLCSFVDSPLFAYFIFASLYVLLCGLMLGAVYCVMKSVLGRTWWNGRRFVTQAGGGDIRAVAETNSENQGGILSTTFDKGVGKTGDETNLDAFNEVSPQERNNNQIQAAPNLRENVTLPVFKTHPVYSTAMPMGTFTMSSGQALGANVIRVSVSNVLAQANVTRLFRDYRYARFDIRFVINVTGNPFSSGLIGIAAFPTPSILPNSIVDQQPAQALDWYNINNPPGMYGRTLAMNHTVADVSIDGVYEVDMPWTHWNTMYQYSDYLTIQNNFGLLMGTVFSPYLPQTGSTSVINMEVTAILGNFQFMETAPLTSQSILNFGGTEVTQVTQKLDHINNANLPVNVTGDTISATVPNPIGLDNPSDPTNAPSALRTVYQKLRSWRNVLDVFKASDAPSRMVDFTPAMAKDLNIDMDEMSMDFFRGRWYPTTPNAFFSFSASTAVNTLLFQDTIDPMPNTTAFTNFDFDTSQCFAVWLTSIFNYWRGSIRYRFLIASNNFKRGKLLFAISYGQIAPFGNIGTGNVDPKSCPHLIVDISNKDRFVDIEVPYKAVMEYLRTQNPAGAVDSRYTNMGRIGCWLVSPLQAMNSTAATVNVTPLKCLGSDFNFFETAPTPRIGWCAQSLLQPQNMSATKNTRSLMMEPFCNIKELLTRPTPLFQAMLSRQPDSADTSADNYGQESFLMPIHPVLWNNAPIWSAITAMYSGMRGGYRLVLRFADVGRAGLTARIQVFPWITPKTSTGAKYQNVAPITSSNPQNWRKQEFAAIYDAAIEAFWPSSEEAGNAAYGVPQTANLTTNQNPVPLNALYGEAPQGLATYGMPCFSDIVIDPYSQPEVIVEVPDPSPMFSSQQTNPLGFGTNIGSTGAYDPTSDNNMPWLAITLMDNNGEKYNLPSATADTVNNVAQPETGCSVSIGVIAADDYRAFWFNGGPTTLQPYCTSYANTGSITPTFYNLWAN